MSLIISSQKFGVKAYVGYKFENDELLLLTKWKNYDDSSNTYEPLDIQLKDNEEMVMKFLERRKRNPKIKKILDNLKQPTVQSAPVKRKISRKLSRRKSKVRKTPEYTPFEVKTQDFNATYKNTTTKTTYDILEWLPTTEVNTTHFEKVQENRCFRFKKRNLYYNFYTEDEGLDIRNEQLIGLWDEFYPILTNTSKDNKSKIVPTLPPRIKDKPRLKDDDNPANQEYIYIYFYTQSYVDGNNKRVLIPKIRLGRSREQTMARWKDHAKPNQVFPLYVSVFWTTRQQECNYNRRKEVSPLTTNWAASVKSLSHTSQYNNLVGNLTTGLESVLHRVFWILDGKKSKPSVYNLTPDVGMHIINHSIIDQWYIAVDIFLGQGIRFSKTT